MKKRIGPRLAAVLVVCIAMLQIPALAAEQHYMYSRYDGAAILVSYGDEAAFAQGYANPDETITMFSRVDGASAVFWSYEVAANQENYATGLQNIRMYSKYDGAMITVHSYEAAGYAANYYGEKATVTIYSTVDGAAYTIWASELAAYLSVGYSTTKPYIAPKPASPLAYPDYPGVPSFSYTSGKTPLIDYDADRNNVMYRYHNVSMNQALAYCDLLVQWGFQPYHSSFQNGGFVKLYERKEGVRINVVYIPGTLGIIFE